MPVTIVVGGQFGSEGKGKVTLELVRAEKNPSITIVRVGGPNSGHTGYSRSGKKFALRQLPAGCIDKNVDVVFPAGSYIDCDVLEREIAELEYPRDRIYVSKYARVITPEHKLWERDAGLAGAIGSTGSGVGAAVMASVAREAKNFDLESPDAQHWGALSSYECDTTELLSKKLSRGERVIVEGSQGFGLSLLDGGFWPKATARSTTAAGALAETGLSPLDVDNVTMVIRSFPIRVAGDSGRLSGETTWSEVAKTTGRLDDLSEFTTVTKKLRRVGVFDAEIVSQALRANNPTDIVMNHLDYVGDQYGLIDQSSAVSKFINRVENDIGRSIDWYGFSEFGMQKSEREKIAG
jgi:adenylosuccinate synthase